MTQWWIYVIIFLKKSFQIERGSLAELCPHDTWVCNISVQLAIVLRLVTGTICLTVSQILMYLEVKGQLRKFTQVTFRSAGNDTLEYFQNSDLLAFPRTSILEGLRP